MVSLGEMTMVVVVVVVVLMSTVMDVTMTTMALVADLIDNNECKKK